jgi:hypothetical protein
MAANNCVKLPIVSASATGRLQLLGDRTIGKLKPRARVELNRIAIRTGTMTMRSDESVRFVVKCWNGISAKNIKMA